MPGADTRVMTSDARRPTSTTGGVAATFDAMAESYDQSGVPYYGQIAAGLVDVLAPQEGERAADLGCGRGAATFALADAVGAGGRVDALDISPVMVSLTGAEARARGLRQVQVGIGDVSDPALPSGGYDLACGSLVLFFLPSPAEGLARWVSLLRPGGRAGISTFREWPESWHRILALITGPAGASRSPLSPHPGFEDDAVVEALFAGAGAVDVTTDAVELDIPFTGAEQWRAMSMGSMLRGAWGAAAPATHPEILARIDEELDTHRGADGLAHLRLGIRYTTGRAPG